MTFLYQIKINFQYFHHEPCEFEDSKCGKVVITHSIIYIHLNPLFIIIIIYICLMMMSLRNEQRRNNFTFV